ncbi:major facilitator superfamily domain-containing protein [Durotheca rogersii]|uniref:major facilitator superfamily domain-containing protein n=1 Tax=Durotheca rogersii TaxID=419775 RepID=UPI0022202172|nr:major facilitator superfamily domain-containing protein [Durotheca rogersii]KAI5867017.1 major facilitator superfamily domain-containing protein [Durotheca rogersii]
MASFGGGGDQVRRHDGESVTEWTALLRGPSATRQAGQRSENDGLAPIAIRRGDGDEYDDGYSSDADLDPNESDMLVARSFTSGASGLAPESFQSAMLRGRRRSRSTMRQPSLGVRSIASVSPRPITREGRQHPDTSSSSTLASDGEHPIDVDVDVDLEVNGENGAKVPSFLIETDNRQFWIVFLSIMLTHFIACFDGTIMASSHPVITSYFRSSNSASWLSTAFLLTSTAFQPIVGRLSDTLGRKVPYLVTIVIFSLATLWCALANSMTSFILARAACGLGAGGTMGLGNIIVSDLVPIERRGAYQSYINIVYGLAAAAGAALGGLMADTLGWRWEFGVQVPPLILCFFIASLCIPGDLGKHDKHRSFVQAMKGFDFGGSALLTTSTAFLILGLNLGGNVLSWSHPFVIGALVTFAVCFPLFLYVESRHERPIMPLALLHNAPRANLIFSNFIASFLLNAILFNTPLFFQAVLLTSATKSGLYLVVPTMAASATGTLTGFLISRTRRLKWPLTLGATGYLVGTGVLAGALRRGTGPTWVYLACLAPASVGQGFQFPGTFMAVLAVSAHREQAVVTSTLVLWRALGSVLGVSGSSLVLQNALLRYLERLVVDAPDPAAKARLIARVRQSVEAVAALPPASPLRAQVVASYEAAIRLTFLCCVAFAAVNVLLVLPIRLPRLGSRT